MADHITEAAARLNRASDELNEAIEAFDDRLQRASIGVTVWLDDRDAAMSDGWRLGYAKLDGAWRVVARKEQGDVVALTSAPRAIRVEAVWRFERLIFALAAEVDRYAANVEAATLHAKEAARG